MNEKLVRITTVPISLNILLKGQLKYLSNYFEVIGIASKGELLDEVNKREGVQVIGVNMERGIHPFKDLVSLFQLYKHIKKEKPVIVHSITPKAGLLSMLAGKMAGVPVRMHTFTGLIFPSKSGLMQKILIKMDQLLCWAATDVYPEGNGVRKDLLRYKITSKPLKVLANGNVNGIDTTYFNPDFFSAQNKKTFRQELHISENAFVFIFVGRLVGDKGINELVRAFRKLNSTGKQRSKLLLVGPFERELDSLHPETEREIRENPDILSVGYQPDVRPYFSIANALVFPSYREGFPNVVLQAGAMGLPSIVTDINGCNEIIVEGINGTIIPPKDANTLEIAMRRFLEKPEYVAQLAKNARRMITDRYEQAVVWEALLEEYKMLLKEKGIEI